MGSSPIVSTRAPGGRECGPRARAVDAALGAECGSWDELGPKRYFWDPPTSRCRSLQEALRHRPFRFGSAHDPFGDRWAAHEDGTADPTGASRAHIVELVTTRWPCG